MKVNLIKGQGLVNIRYDTIGVLRGLTQRRTTVTIKLPGGDELTGRALCDTRDQFVKRVGRLRALMKILKADTDQAVETAMCVEKIGRNVAQAAKGYYKLSRDDRRTIFGVVCPEFSNAPTRRVQREKALLKLLKERYEKT